MTRERLENLNRKFELLEEYEAILKEFDAKGDYLVVRRTYKGGLNEDTICHMHWDGNDQDSIEFKQMMVDFFKRKTEVLRKEFEEA